MKRKREIQKLKRFLESKDISTMEAGPFTVWEVLKWVLDEECVEGEVGGGIRIEGNKVSLGR